MDEVRTLDGEFRLPIRFVGSGSEYFRIWIVNLLLTLVTLGLYYPYAKVRRLRYFHGATEIGGQPMGYHANPHKMLRGYLLVAAMMGGYALAGRVSEVAGAVAFCIVAAVWPMLWHASLQFRLANTSWRGLRFRFTGSRAGAYAALAPGYVVAALLVGVGATVGVDGQPSEGMAPLLIAAGLSPLALLLMMPWMFWLVRRYQHRHYALGDEQARFLVGVGAFYGLSFRLIALSLVAGVLSALASFVVVAGFGLGGGNKPSSYLGAGLGFLAVMGAFQLVMRPYWVSRTQNLVWNGTVSDHLRLHSALRASHTLKLMARNWGLILVTLGLYYPFAAVAMARLRLEAVEVLSRIGPDELLSSTAANSPDAAGDAAGDLLGLDIGL